ncbi:CASP8-associated protein 2 isoform X1 [Hemitrygon akajei]|uniref:CASP8-associated protein 2 isoform X1 n=2 Tax=Hemitrygon akajei TaxID=2704970 RepID=UPI003BFA35F1
MASVQWTGSGADSATRWRISKNIMDRGEASSSADYLHYDLLQEDSFVKSDNENSVDIYDGLDTDYQGGGQSASCDASGKNKPAKDCFDLYEEILAEEGTAKAISLKEFQEKSIERERKVEELLQKLHEVETKNSTLSNENIQLKKNISALIKTARQEINRKDEEINRLNRRHSMNWIGNPCLRRHNNQHAHPPGSLNVPITSQNDNTHSRLNLPCPSRSANVEQCLLTSRVNEEGNCPQVGPLGCGNKIIEPKSQCNLPRNAKFLSSPHSPVGREHSSKSSSHTSIVPPHKPNATKDKAELTPCKERKGTEKLNGEDLCRHGTVEKSYILELSAQGNKIKEPIYLQKIDKREQTSQSARSHSEVRSTSRHASEKCSDRIRHRLDQGSSGNSADPKESKSQVEKEKRHKEEIKKSDHRSREQATDRKKEQRSNQEDAQEKHRDDRLRSRSFQKEREPERRHSEKRSESSKLMSPTSPCRSSRRSVHTAVDHSSRERRDQKVESKSSGKERSTDVSRDRRNNQSNRKVPDEKTVKDNVRRSGKDDSRNLKKDGNRKEKDKSEQKENQRDHGINKHSLRNGRDVVNKEPRSEKDKTKLTEENQLLTKGHCTEDAVRGRSSGNLQSSTDEQSSVRDADPKLHFMETLQLTVSPVKKPSIVPHEVETSCTRALSAGEMVEHAESMASMSENSYKKSSHEASKDQGKDTDSETTEMHLGESEVSVPPANQESMVLEMPSAQAKDHEVEEDLLENSDPVESSQVVVETFGTVEVISEIVSEEVENSPPLEEISANEHLESVGNPSKVDEGVLNKVSQQLIEADDTIDRQCEDSDCPAETVSSEKALSLTGTGNSGDFNQPQDVATADAGKLPENSEPDLTDREVQHTPAIDSSAITTPVKKPCVPDDLEDNSIQSIDFAYIGCIGAPISPLTSPLRPVRSSELEKSGTSAERNVDYKDSEVKMQDNSSESSCTLELNKENQEPLCKEGIKTLGTSEEIEEGEIVSDVDECVSQVQKPACNIEVMKESSSEEKGNPNQRANEKETRMVNPDEPSVKYYSEVLPKNKSVKKQGEKAKVMSSNQNTEGLRISSLSSVEKNQIKSSIADLMEALISARKSIRQKYMKLHKQFEVRRFKRIIEIAIVEFTSAVKKYKFPKSRKQQKSSICALIETVLSQVKSNGIVNTIFSQQALNMKEKLWLFVEKQFDFMFDKIREIFISCENISLELALERGRKNEKVIKSKKKNAVVKHKADKVPKLKKSPSSEPCLTNDASGKRNSEKKKLAADRSRKNGAVVNRYSKNKTEVSAGGISKENSQPPTNVKNLLSVSQMNWNASSDSLINSNSTKDSHEKTELGILTEQQASTLTFNLVSDAQMGEIFKCLLQGSDLLEQGMSALECNSWSAPEKMHPDVNTHLSSVPSTSEKAPLVSQGDGVSWPPVTPNKHAVGLRPPLNIDILDESCMLEIPDKVVPNKDALVISQPEDSNSQKVNEASSGLQARASISSILMEDLAVSLTVPSPLKSDGEISFLTSQNGLSLPGEVSEAILSSHYSENAVLDEEDASEQDIHLALDSDNSSSRSSSSSTWNKQTSTSSFQYRNHPPMQAVVMEKSNDHFIVKIRCKASSTNSSLQSLPSAAAVKENETSKLGLGGQPVVDTIDKRAILPKNNVQEMPKNNVQEMPEKQVHVMSESLPNHSITLKHPVGESRGTEESGMEVDISLPPSEKDKLSLPKNCTDHLPSLEAPSGNTKGNVLLIGTVLKSTPSSGNKKRKCNVKVDSAEKRARKEPEPLNASTKNDDKANTKRKSTSSAKKAVKKTADTPEKMKCNTRRSTVPSQTSLPAKNIIKKNGEVVIAWTREDDRSILLDCQQKGANEETFSYISKKLNRSPRQVSERFRCLMKLFKRTKHE